MYCLIRFLVIKLLMVTNEHNKLCKKGKNCNKRHCFAQKTKKTPCSWPKPSPGAKRLPLHKQIYIYFFLYPDCQTKISVTNNNYMLQTQTVYEEIKLSGKDAACLWQTYNVSVLGRDNGYTVKYSPSSEGVPKGKARWNFWRQRSILDSTEKLSL